jgi:hypothetical protein
MWYSPQEQLRNREHGLFWSTTLYYLYDVFFSQVHAIAMQFQDAPLATKIEYKWIDGRATLFRIFQGFSKHVKTLPLMGHRWCVYVAPWHRAWFLSSVLSGRPGWEQHHYGPFPGSFFFVALTNWGQIWKQWKLKGCQFLVFLCVFKFWMY